MGEKNDEARREQQRLARVLSGIEKTAREASLTGQLSGGQAVAIRQYNAIVERLERTGTLPEGVFVPLPEGAEFDEVGVAASGLAQYLRDNDEEEEGRRRGRTGGGVFEAGPGHVKIVGFPGDISDLGVMLREYLPDFLRQRIGEAMSGAPIPPEPPIPPIPPVPPAPPAPPAPSAAGFHGGSSGGSWNWSFGGGPGAPPSPPGEGFQHRHEHEVRVESQTRTESPGNVEAEIEAFERRIAELTAQLGAPNPDPGFVAAAARELADVAQRRAVLEQRRGEGGPVEV